MTEKNFDIKILDLHWIENVDDPADLCLHGHIYVKIGTEIISNKDIGDWTLSSTALYLMRTININYIKGDFANQLLPCCGHFFIADPDNDYVIIMGCPFGIDWEIIHTNDDKIKHISESGQEAIIGRNEYIKIVFEIADQVEKYYNQSLPKIIPIDEINQKGYLAFWKEWKNLRDQYRQ